MRFTGAWYAFALLAVLVVTFELFFRFRYVPAGDRLWRIDRITERACMVQIGESICSAPAPPVIRRPARNPYLASPTPEPNPY